jgi:hypothetical protein
VQSERLKILLKGAAMRDITRFIIFFVHIKFMFDVCNFNGISWTNIKGVAYVIEVNVVKIMPVVMQDFLG